MAENAVIQVGDGFFILDGVVGNSEIREKHQEKSKTPYRFSSAVDCILLREVVSRNPYNAAHGESLKVWTDIAEAVKGLGIPIDARRCRDRTRLLLLQFQKDEREALKKSGTEEEFQEKEVLLQEITDLMAEKDILKNNKRQKCNKEKKEAAVIRDAALGLETSVNGNEDSICSAPEPKRRRMVVQSQDTFVEYLKLKQGNKMNQQSAENALREKELNLEERKIKIREEELQFEKEKFEMEREERLKRLEIEHKERRAFMNVIMRRT